MKKIFISVLILHFAFYVSQSVAAQPNDFLTPSSYNMMEPYMNNTMKNKLKPKDAEYTGRSSNRTASARRVVSRSATVSHAQSRNVVSRAPAAGIAARSATNSPSQNRTVVSRARSSVNDAREALPTNTNIVTGTGSVLGNVTVPQCLSRYTECMDGYCHRSGTEYDRCYCSPKLAQLDGEYKPQIDDLLKRITIVQNGGVIEDGMTQEEINNLWNELFGASGENSMADLDAALNINWAGTESTVRGQNAFVAGDSYCKQQLEMCFYMSENLKSMYRSTIGQDCKKYETKLKKLKSAAEQILANYE